jgi:hypothetical protein
MACTDPQQQGLKKMLQQTTNDEHSTNTAQSHHNHLAPAQKCLRGAYTGSGEQLPCLPAYLP